MEDNIFKKLRMSLNNGAGITQKELAGLLNINDSRLCDLETGKRTPSKSQLTAYHKFFNVPIEQLMGLKTASDDTQTSKKSKKSSEIKPDRSFPELKDLLFNTIYGQYVAERLDRIIFYDNEEEKKKHYKELEILLRFGEQKSYKSYNQIELSILLDNLVGDLDEEEDSE